MIPKIIHYCWFGRGQMPQSALDCIESWHRFMPDWEYRLWNEDNFDVNMIPYTKEAYEAGKYAFVSDVARLKALEEDGGVYLDTDVEVFKTFDDLLGLKAFGGFEGSKHLPLLTCVLGSEAHGEWVSEQLSLYQNRTFIKENGEFDYTTNVQLITANMVKNGFVQNGIQQQYKDLTVFPVDWFSPHRTTGEYIRTENTYSDHKCYGSWIERGDGKTRKLQPLKIKIMIGVMVGQRNMTRLIKLKRHLLG